MPKATSQQGDVISVGTLPLYERPIRDKEALAILGVSRATLFKMKIAGTLKTRVVAVGANGPIRRTSLEEVRRYVASLNGGQQ